MAKPSKKRTSNRARKQSAAQAPKPEPTVEEMKQEIAKFDHDGDGRPGGSLPKQAEAPVTEVPAETSNAVDGPVTEVESATDAAQPEQAEGEEPEGEQPQDPEPEADPEVPETVAPSQNISLGPVECRLAEVPLGAVLGLLSSDELRRVEAHKGSSTFEATRKRLLASDGRATPVIFEAGEQESSKPCILHGFEELAAAEDCGVNELTVILVPAGEGPAAQAHIVEMVRQQRMTKEAPDDEELFYRINAGG